jgi:tetratricopeptide (TPR) repeat protein
VSAASLALVHLAAGLALAAATPPGGEDARGPAAAYAARAYAEGAKGLTEAAIADFTKALALRPDADAFFGRGALYERKGLYDRAIADLSAAIRLRPAMAAAYASRGVAYDQKGRYAEAASDYTRALALGPAAAQTYFNRGAAYEHARLYAQAAADYRAALAIDPSLEPAKAGLKRLISSPAAGPRVRRARGETPQGSACPRACPENGAAR